MRFQSKDLVLCFLRMHRFAKRNNTTSKCACLQHEQVAWQDDMQDIVKGPLPADFVLLPVKACKDGKVSGDEAAQCPC